MMGRAILLLSLATLLGVHPAMGQESLTQDDIKNLPHITAMQAFYLSKQNKILLLDVHDGSERSQIVGAYYLPSKQIESVRLKIPKNQLIGVFCD